MGHSLSSRILLVLLAIQLAAGWPAAPAHAADHTPARGAGVAAMTAMSGASRGSAAHELDRARVDRSGVDNSPCVVHVGAQLAGKSLPAPLGEKHDCCKSSGCQCQCGSQSIAFDVSSLRGAPAASRERRIDASYLPSSPADVHFRPPIAF